MYWYDGKLIEQDTIKLGINNPGLLYGATVFTTMQVYQRSLSNPLTNWKAHSDRLHQSLNSFGWQFSHWERLKQGAEKLALDFPVLRITIFPDGKELIIGRFLPEDLTDRQQQGIIAWVADEQLFRRSQPNHKTGNYLGAYLALQKAQQLGAKEAILIDDLGNYLETSTGNLWGYKNGCWYTPCLESGILPGIARSQILKYLNCQQIPVKENIWTLDFVENLEAIAYSNCVVNLIPIRIIMAQNRQIIFNNFVDIIQQISQLFPRD
jgi:4-amino-4-deoxychorismate lyase